MRILEPIITTRNGSDMRLELITGGTIEIWTLTNPDAGRSRKYKRIIIDEAALVPDLLTIWNTAIRQTLVDYAGDAFFLSTPKGRNGFWRMYQWADSDHVDGWECWQMPTASNPYIPPAEIEAMRAALPERIFAQEIMAQFLDDAGGVFRRVMDAATGTEQAPQAGRQYLFGVDWGKSNDFTVITVDSTDPVTRFDGPLANASEIKQSPPQGIPFTGVVNPTGQNTGAPATPSWCTRVQVSLDGGQTFEEALLSGDRLDNDGDGLADEETKLFFFDNVTVGGVEGVYDLQVDELIDFVKQNSRV